MGIEITGLFGLILLGLNIWAMLNVAQSGSSTAGKVIWIIAILILPLMGFLGWLIFGPRKQ